MVYSVDAAVEVLRTIDCPFQEHSGIFAFQQDNQLYLIGRKAVAVVDGGIPCSNYLSNHDETLDSYISQPFRGKSEVMDEKRRIVKSEAKFFLPLVRDSDGERSTLEDLLKIGEMARKENLDDGRIRMVSHGTRYHSHKHGYAVDGVDVSVTDARVMLRHEYFDLMRMQELRARETLDRDDGGENTSMLLGIVVITNHALLSFPFPTKFRQDDYRNDLNRHYGNDSPFVNEAMTSFSRGISSSTESPYTFNVNLLGGNLPKTSSPDDFSKNYGEILKTLERLKDCYTPGVQAIVEEANSLHNSKHAKRIAEWSAIRGEGQQRQSA
jgi:hypothetical protein